MWSLSIMKIFFSQCIVVPSLIAIGYINHMLENACKKAIHPSAYPYLSVAPQRAILY